MTKTFRRTGFEYQRSPIGAPDGALSNALARVSGNDGEMIITTETDRIRLRDTVFGAFVAATHEGRLITLRNTPPAPGGTNGSNRMENWTFRIVAVIDANNIELEGVRWDVAGTSVEWTIHAAVDFTALSANFPQDTGPTGTGADGENRSNTGPCEWQAISLPTPNNSGLRIYPFVVTRRTSSTVLRLSDPFDNLQTFPIETNLAWSLIDRPCYTHEQLYKIIHTFMYQSGWEVHQCRGKNNGAGCGGNNVANTFIVHDTVYYSPGEDGNKRQYLRFAAFHRSNSADGTDSQNNFGFDWAFYSAWDRSFASVTIGSGVTTNPGNGINALSSHISTSVGQHWAAQADTVNTSANAEPWWSPDNGTGDSSLSGSVFGNGVPWGSPFHATAANRNLRPNILNTPEGGAVQQIEYAFFGSMDEVHLWAGTAGYGWSYIGLGSLELRADSNPNNFVTTFTALNGVNVQLRIGATNPAATTPPYQVGDSIQMVGQRVNSPIVPQTSHAGEFIQTSTISALPGQVAAIGTIDCIAGASHVDGELLTMDDGEGNVVTFEFDDNASVQPGNVAIDITGVPSANTMATRHATAINGTLLNIAAVANGARVDLTHGTVGVVGNVAMSETVANTGYVIEGMAGGGYAIEVASLANTMAAGALVGEDPQALFFFRGPMLAQPVGTAPTQGSFRVSNRSRNNHATYHDHNGPGTTPGGDNSNGFNCIARLEGLSQADTRPINPNLRSGRMGLASIHCVDTTGNQIRGRMRYCRYANARAGSKVLVRDRNGDYHFLLPQIGRMHSIGGDTDHRNLVLALGPMPAAMAFVG